MLSLDIFKAKGIGNTIKSDLSVDNIEICLYPMTS
jgi:hypothetical protein